MKPGIFETRDFETKKMILVHYFSIENGKLVFLPQSKAQSLPHETFESGALKCAARNAAFALICKEFSQKNPMHIMVIDSAENITMFHLVAGLVAGSEKKRLNLVELNLVAVSHSVEWNNFSDGTISLQGLPSTRDAYSKAHYDGCNYNAIFLDACGLAPGLLNDICGMSLRNSTNSTNQRNPTNSTNPVEVSVFETIAVTGGVFGITWQNTRQYCTGKNLRRTDLSKTTRNVIFGYTDAAGIYQPGYGVYVKQKSKNQKSKIQKSQQSQNQKQQQKPSNDEIPHYEWMIGLMQHVAKMHGFQLELAYSAYESKGCMRTVIFRVFPLDVFSHDSFVYSQLSALESFYPCLSDEALKVHGNALYNQYLVPVFTEALEQFQDEQFQNDRLRIQTLWSAIEKKITTGKISPPIPLMSAPPMTAEQRELRALLTQVAEVVPFMSRENCEVGIKCLLPLFQDAFLASEMVLPEGFDDMKGKALLETIIERRHEKQPNQPKEHIPKHIPNEDYVLETGNVSKIHRGGFECKAVKAFSAKKYITLQTLTYSNDTGNLDKCKFCFAGSKRERE